MAHTLANEKASRDTDDLEVIIIDHDQEEDIKRQREKLRQALAAHDSKVRLSSPPVLVRKRKRDYWSDSDEPSSRRLCLANSRRADVARPSKPPNPLDQLSDNILIEIFMHLPQFPSLLTVRQVCRRWYHLSCNPRLWSSLSFEGQEHVTSENLEALCKKTPSLQRLRSLSLAKVHGVNENAVRKIPRTECAATLETVDLSWCSGATDKSVVEFSRCPRLRELRLSHCREVTRRSVRILAVRCPKLEVLDMNCISGLRDSLLFFIGQHCPYLRVLNIANGRNITDEGVGNIARGCPRLEVLELSWCGRVTDWSITWIASGCPQLRVVGLSETRVSNNGLSELTRSCKKLDTIYLARCASVWDDGVLTILQHCGSRLKGLNLASCEHVTDACVERLINECPVLECLDVSRLPCRPIADMVKRVTEKRAIEVFF